MTGGRYVPVMPAGLLLDVPVLPGARCVPGNSDLPPGFWDADASAAEHRAAIAVCRACPALDMCRSWFNGLTKSQKPTGIIAGSSYALYPTRTPAAAVRRDVTVHAGLAVAVGIAYGTDVRRNGRSLGKRRAASLAYRQEHAEQIAARKRELYDISNKRRRERRAASPEAVRAAERARYAANRDAVNEQRRAARAADPEPYRAADRARWPERKRQRAQKSPPPGIPR